MPDDEERCAELRRQMVASLAGYSVLHPIRDARVLAALNEVPRHEFVPAGLRHLAYADTPLGIGEGQTISQPFMVAYMTQLLELGPEDRVLEIGTGSGYQTAVLARLAREVFSVEIRPALGLEARTRLSRLGIGNVRTRIGDGYLGWPEHAPFDAVIGTCAPDHVPQPLVDQLKVDGRMVLPVGPRDTCAGQELLLLRKTAQGARLERRMGVRFVPLVRELGGS